MLSQSDDRVLIVGIVKDVSKTLVQDIERLSEAFCRFTKISWFLVESNSNDETRKLLEVLKKTQSDFNFVTLDASPDTEISRTVALAEARNRYVEEVAQNPKFQSVSYIVVSDFNNLNRNLTRTAVDSCFTAERSWDVCCANQSGPYYDIWALRHPLWSPNDCWEAHAFFRKYSLIPETALTKSVNSRMIRIKPSSEWIEVDSAFGGLAVYKRATFIKGVYEGLTPTHQPICEHVPFNLSLRAQGAKIFINPKLINFNRTDHSIRSGLVYQLFRILHYPKKLLRNVLNS
jgi:hypothetical protein